MICTCIITTDFVYQVCMAPLNIVLCPFSVYLTRFSLRLSSMHGTIILLHIVHCWVYIILLHIAFYLLSVNHTATFCPLLILCYTAGIIYIFCCSVCSHMSPRTTKYAPHYMYMCQLNESSANFIQCCQYIKASGADCFSALCASLLIVMHLGYLYSTWTWTWSLQGF